jgi:hypothetical protein
VGVDRPDKEARLRDLPNCWEIMKCAKDVCRECPAHPDHGRECWKLTGTKCDRGSLEKASLSEKIIYCRSHCKYYREYVSKIYP